MAGLRNAKADGQRKLRNLAGAAQQRGKIRGKRVLLTGYAGTRNEIEKAGRAGGDFFETVVGGSRGAKENGTEMMRGENAAVAAGLFPSENADEANGVARRNNSGSDLVAAPPNTVL